MGEGGTGAVFKAMTIHRQAAKNAKEDCFVKATLGALRVCAVKSVIT
jgi:hypothetical protein